jgi:hypothetical protein
LLVSVLLTTRSSTKTGKFLWLGHRPQFDRKRFALVAFLDEANTSIERLLIFQNILFGKTKIPEDSEWLRSGIPLKQASDLLATIREIRDTPGQ